ncbi:MAG TPA: tol-pal system-associated acyl-CoA thioesterase [Leucothrix mucor]|uniref:Tol-pal system-associated acyl-CoA thioesterase n=1 Tax=Leucothrix mucor TaxID=45248 RepID=A0A7V2SZC0_LEUMU|nr:tol-pal system-associated acyl-CoA thioesterase [Leucothrix mucor]
MTIKTPTNSNSFSFPLRVYYEDTDAGGVVYHSNYLNFFERARTEWLRDLGYEQSDLRLKEKIIFVVRNIEIAYLKPALFNDQLIATVKIIKIGRSSIEVEQQILRQTADHEVLSTGKVIVVCVDADTFRPKKIPDNIRSVILIK